MILPCDTTAVVHSNRVTVDRQHLIAYDFADGLECLDFGARRHSLARSIAGDPVALMECLNGCPPSMAGPHAMAIDRRTDVIGGRHPDQVKGQQLMRREQHKRSE